MINFDFFTRVSWYRWRSDSFENILSISMPFRPFFYRIIDLGFSWEVVKMLKVLLVSFFGVFCNFDLSLSGLL